MTTPPPFERSWPAPSSPWAMAMRWHDLLFMHWRIAPELLRSKLPEGLELDTWDGSAWIAVVPFRMSNVRPRGWPGVPWLSAFPELNVRTYVKPVRTARGTELGDEKPGVWFLSLDAANPLAVRGARARFHLPYFDARMSCRERAGAIEYHSVRTDDGAPSAEFMASYRAIGPTFHARAGTLEHFLTARFCLYATGANGQLLRCEIDHPLWPLQLASCHVERNSMLAAHGLPTPDGPPLLHFAHRLDVVAWRPSVVGRDDLLPSERSQIWKEGDPRDQANNSSRTRGSSAGPISRWFKPL